MKPKTITRRFSLKKGALRNSAKLTEKYLCRSLFFNKIVGLNVVDTLTQVFSRKFHKKN